MPRKYYAGLYLCFVKLESHGRITYNNIIYYYKRTLGSQQQVVGRHHRENIFTHQGQYVNNIQTENIE